MTEKAQEASLALTELASDIIQDDGLQSRVLDLIDSLAGVQVGVEEGSAAKNQVPLVKLRHPTTSPDYMPEETPIGGFFTSGGDNLGKKFDFVPLYVHPVRSMWPDQEDPNQSDLQPCRSEDGKVGSIYGDCSACPHGRYVKGQRTLCSKGTRVYAVGTDLDRLVYIDFMKTSSAAGRLIPRLARPKLWSKAFTLSSEQKEGTKAKYYVMKTALNRDATPDEETQKICAGFTELITHVRADKLEQFKQRASERKDAQVEPSSESVIDITVGDSEDDAIDLSGAL